MRNKPAKTAVKKPSALPAQTQAALTKAIALHQQGNIDAAQNIYESILKSHPKNFDALHLLGVVAYQKKSFLIAKNLISKAISINDSHAASHLHLGNTFQEMLQFEEAKNCFINATLLSPHYTVAYFNLGNVNILLSCLEEAEENYSRAFKISSSYEFLLGVLLQTRMKICDWRDYEHNVNELSRQIENGQKVTYCFPLLGLTDSLHLQHQAAQIYMANKFPPDDSLGPIPKKTRSGRIKIGYYSADLHNHATSHLMAELFERHDKTQFELFAFSFGSDIQDEMRARLVLAFDHFIDIRLQSDKDVAQLSRELGIDIAIDLKGYTTGARPRIFSYRAAPIQVSYLGYPGTLGTSYMDYLIADPILIPAESRAYYSEKIAYLPNSYQVNDRKRAISSRRFSKQELGLPQEGFVFCCFNNNFKITPDMLDTWVRILNAVEGSVLWLFEDNAAAGRNLRKQAALKGLDASRLVFAPRMNLPEHLARHEAADLFLDTIPCNAHTTASDALWAGLPVLTCTGEAFASRVAASLLHAIKLPELVTTNIKDYEDLAIELAHNPMVLKQLKDKLAANRLTTPLFDTELFTSNLESCYALMLERYHSDLPNEHIF